MAERGPHVFPVRVYYEDTDAAGIVYYANYLKCAERSRTEWLRAGGIGQRALSESDGVAFAVRRLTADYITRARLDDLLEVRSRILSVGGASFDAEQDLTRDGQPVAHLMLTLACVARSGRPARLPPAVRHALDADLPHFTNKTSHTSKREIHG